MGYRGRGYLTWPFATIPHHTECFYGDESSAAKFSHSAASEYAKLELMLLSSFVH